MFDALADTEMTVIATLPSNDLGALRVPPNGRAEKFIPHGPILARASVAITHGGMGVTQKALTARVPVVAVPFGRDQPEVARRVEVAGAGVRLPRGRLRPETIRAAVATAMTCRGDEILQSETGDPKYPPHPLLRKMVRAGRLGRKTGQGFYISEAVQPS